MRLPIVAVLAVLLGLPALAGAQGGYVEPPPSPPRGVAPPQRPAVVEPPVARSGAEEEPSTFTTTTTSASPTPTPTATPTPTPTPTATPTATAAPAEAPAYEPYSPSQITWGAAPTPTAAHDPAVASTAVTIRAIELAFGVLAQEGGGMVEVGMLADLGGWALGGLLTGGGVNEHVGFGVHLAGGPRLALGGNAWLDLQVDAGLVFFGDDGQRSQIAGSTETSGSDAVLPAAGARLGVTFRSPERGWFLSLGAGLRHVQRETVQYTVTDCRLLATCVTTPATSTYGGTVAGGYLTFGRSYARGR